MCTVEVQVYFVLVLSVPVYLQVLLAKYLDSYFHYLSTLPGVEEVVSTLKRNRSKIFQIIQSLRRPEDRLAGDRYQMQSVCFFYEDKSIC